MSSTFELKSLSDSAPSPTYKEMNIRPGAIFFEYPGYQQVVLYNQKSLKHDSVYLRLLSKNTPNVNRRHSPSSSTSISMDLPPKSANIPVPMPTPGNVKSSFWSLTPITTTTTTTNVETTTTTTSERRGLSLSTDPDSSPIAAPRPTLNTSNTPQSINIHVWLGKNFKIPKFTFDNAPKDFAKTEQMNRKDADKWRRYPLRYQFGLHLGQKLSEVLKFIHENTSWNIVIEEDGAESKEFFSHLSR